MRETEVKRHIEGYNERERERERESVCAVSQRDRARELIIKTDRNYRERKRE